MRFNKSVVEFKAIPYRFGYITGLNYVYKTKKGKYYSYDDLTGKITRISEKWYMKINQKAEALTMIK